MAEQVKLKKQTHDAIVRRARAGQSRAAIMAELGLNERIVGKVLAANGLTKSKQEVVERDKATVAKWLAAR